jgi:hypothetical protein
MAGLKAFLPEISRIFSTTPAALYERQRALVRLGLLTGAEGRGPGSGVPLSADNLAALIIALAVTDNLSDTDARVQKLCDAAPVFKSICPFTKATNLRAALAAVLSSAKLAKQLWLFSVDRNELSAMILYKPRIRAFDSTFAQPKKEERFAWHAISTKSFIGRDTFQSTERALARSLADGDNDNLGGVE